MGKKSSDFLLPSGASTPAACQQPGNNSRQRVIASEARQASFVNRLYPDCPVRQSGERSLPRFFISNHACTPYLKLEKRNI